MNKRALIAMSGGVDSSVAALLMKERGFDCIGATMKLFNNEDIDLPRDHSCCSLEDAEDARSVAEVLGMPHYVFNFSDRFKETVIDRFISAYERGETPNPCIDCNRYLKFDKLYRRARELDYDCVATGHYARIVEEDGRFLLKKAVDQSKDQSYVLYSLTPEQLSRTVFPLGDMLKFQVREIAEKNGFVNAKKHDSQDICFVQNGKYGDFIRTHSKRLPPEGDFVDLSGRVLGRHKGIYNYTVGQRRGLGLALPASMYVCGIDVDNNRVILGFDEDLFSTSLTAGEINLISVDSITEPMRVRAKVRYAHRESPATVIQTGEDEIKVEFDEPQRAITKGQAVVLYDGDTVVGGGVIR